MGVEATSALGGVTGEAIAFRMAGDAALHRLPGRRRRDPAGNSTGVVEAAREDSLPDRNPLDVAARYRTWCCGSHRNRTGGCRLRSGGAPGSRRHGIHQRRRELGRWQSRHHSWRGSRCRMRVGWWPVRCGGRRSRSRVSPASRARSAPRCPGLGRPRAPPWRPPERSGGMRRNSPGWQVTRFAAFFLLSRPCRLWKGVAASWEAGAVSSTRSPATGDRGPGPGCWSVRRIHVTLETEVAGRGRSGSWGDVI
jgi:hypothetical protein